jgi:hypothetical protein
MTRDAKVSCLSYASPNYEKGVGREKWQNTFLFIAPQSIVWRNQNFAHLSTW